MKDLFDRVQEHRERPQALAALTGMLNTSEVYLTAIQALKGEIFTEVEITTLAKAINETRVGSGLSSSFLLFCSLPRETVTLSCNGALLNMG